MQGRQGSEGTGRLSSRCPSAVKLALLLSSFNSWWYIQYMWEGAARWSTQFRRGCWVATGLSRWMGCSDPQGPGRGRESINPSKMKLCPGCHNLFASSKLYKLFAVFFAFGWWLIWYSWDPICRGVAFEFLCSPEVICGNTWKDVLFLQNKRKPAASRKPKHKNAQTNNKTRKPNHKYTNKQNNQNLGKQTEPCCVNNGSMYNRVKSME